MSDAVAARRAEAQAARARLSNTFAAIRRKTSPKSIAHEAVESAREIGNQFVDNAREKGVQIAETSVEVVRKNPQASAAAAAVAVAFVFRRPIGRLFASVFRRRKPPKPSRTALLAAAPSHQEEFKS